MAVPLELLKFLDLPVDTSEEVLWFCFRKYSYHLLQ